MEIIEKLNSLYNRSKLNKDGKIDRKLYNLLYQKEMLNLAYENIKNKSGKRTPGITRETIDGMSLAGEKKIIETIADQLKKETFQFKTSGLSSLPLGLSGASARGITGSGSRTPTKKATCSNYSRRTTPCVYPSFF